MANRYTYDDFQKAMQSSGLGGQFSDADLKLAQQNPDAGMSILKYKQDYKNAATDEARALANLGAEGIRSSYGGYTGWQRGANFYLDPLSPKDFQSSAAPTYKNNYADTISGLFDKQLGIMARDSITEEYARSRIAAQKDADYFRAQCDYEFVNDLPTAEKAEHAAEVYINTIINNLKEETER